MLLYGYRIEVIKIRELRDYRVKLNLTQQDVATALGISRISVSRYENNKRKLSTKLFGGFCEVLKIPQKQRLKLLKSFNDDEGKEN